MLDHFFVFVEMLRLDADGAIPFETEPGEILKDGLSVLWLAAPQINVFDPEQHLATGAPCRVPDMEGRRRMAEMQEARRRGRKAGHEIRHATRLAKALRADTCRHRAGDACAANPAIAIRVLGEILLVVILSMIEFVEHADLGRDIATAGLYERLVVDVAR